MYSRAALRCLLVALCTILIDGRLVPLQLRGDDLLTVDVLNTPVIPIEPIATTAKPPARANVTVCYPVVGCFDNNDPYNNAALEVPQAPTVVDTNFLLFTHDSPTNPDFLQYDGNDESIIGSRLNSSRWLRIIVHGFTNNRDSAWIAPLKDELLKLKDNEESNVLVVDWGKGAKFPFYPNAASNTRLVGKELGLLLQKLHDLMKFPFDKVHCIGHSLGAHTCGYASNIIDRQMARISGLDPAGPFFEGKNALTRLDKDDAKFVDVIHTNTEIAFGLGLGSSESSGHIDFYVNGGQHQPGCPSVTSMITGLFGGQSESSYEQSSCSHGRAHGYFIESINSECPYTAFPCHNYDSFMNGKCLVCPASGCAQMGFNSIYSLGRGNMYLSTKNASPFCGYHYFIELVLDRDMVKTSGEVFVAVHSNYEMLANISMSTKSNADFRPGDVLRHIFSFNADLGKVDYAIVYFNKAKSFLGFGGGKGNDVIISRLRLKSLENTVAYSAACETHVTVPAYTSQTMLLNRYDCRDD